MIFASCAFRNFRNKKGHQLNTELQCGERQEYQAFCGPDHPISGLAKLARRTVSRFAPHLG